ncbi:MAG: preprotein translocase subunit SecG [Candidatus Magasanikbacteria bacterium]|nr:preprotein translocase subunit SecG [Candidatus Magasanikbacteria bacterium]
MIVQIIQIVQLVLAVLLIVVILLQQQSAGLGSAFGGSGSVQTTRRGADKFLFRATIIISILFFLSALAQIII